jgi:hypothetical protein
MIVHLLPQAFALLLLPIASSLPLDAHSTLVELSKRLDKPPVPGASDLRPHLIDIPEGRCLFYTGGTLDAASDYADKNDLFILGDLDKDGWAGPSDEYKDEEGKDDYNPQCPMSWAFQKQYVAAGVGWGKAERDQYFDNLSEAFAQKCNGDVYLALPPSRQIPEDSVFYRVEWPVLRNNPTVNNLIAVVLQTGGNVKRAPPPGTEVIWSRCKSTEN